MKVTTRVAATQQNEQYTRRSAEGYKNAVEETDWPRGAELRERIYKKAYPEQEYVETNYLVNL